MKRVLTFIAALMLLCVQVAMAQQTIYQDGNVSIVQNPGGWQILIGSTAEEMAQNIINLLTNQEKAEHTDSKR